MQNSGEVFVPSSLLTQTRIRSQQVFIRKSEIRMLSQGSKFSPVKRYTAMDASIAAETTESPRDSVPLIISATE